MADKPLLECSFLIPFLRDRNRSDGKMHSKTAWLWLNSDLEAFGGATYDTAPVEGWYIDQDTNQRVRDQSRRYSVAMPKSELFALRALLREACSIFAQKCIYLSIAGQVEFVKGKRHEKK
jgi:hypothetical protein